MSNFFSKTIAFTKFLQKSVRENYCNFNTWKLQKFTVTEKKVRQMNYLLVSLSDFFTMLLSRNICHKRVRVNFRKFHTVAERKFP